MVYPFTHTVWRIFCRVTAELIAARVSMESGRSDTHAACGMIKVTRSKVTTIARWKIIRSYFLLQKDFKRIL